MIDLTIYCSSSICQLCGEPLHPCIGCQEARFRRKKAKLEEPWMLCYYKPPPSPYFYDYDTTVEDGYYSDGCDRDEDAYYESMTDERCFCCGRDHTHDYEVCAVYLKNPAYWNKKMKDSRISRPYQGYLQDHPEKYSEPEGDCTYQNEEDGKLAKLEVILSKFDEYLSTPNLSDEHRISCLVSKCKYLKMKIELEERLSPLPDDIRDYSYMKDEVVEDNTAPMNPLSDEDSQMYQMVCKDDEVGQSDKVIVCIEPLPISIIPTSKCGEEGSRKNIRKAKLQYTSIHKMKWIYRTRMCFLSMPIILKSISRWHVNYRAFIGNTVGKCALKPP